MNKLMIATLFCALIVACSPSQESSEFAFQSETVLDAETKLGGCAAGDLDPDRPGDEIAALSVDGTVYLAWREGGAWEYAEIGQADGELIQCAIGDVAPDLPGNELVAVGMKSGTEEGGGPGAAYLFFKQDEGWKQELIFEDTALIHGVCVGDLDPERAGNEILLVGFSQKATLAARKDGAFVISTVTELSGPGKMAVAHEGGAAIVCADGSVIQLTRRDGVWKSTVIDKTEAGQARIDSDGRRLLLARDDGVLALLFGGERTELRKEDSKLRGAVLADLDPDSPGLEAASAGYDMAVNVLFEETDGWRAVEVFKDTGRLHHLAAGRFSGLGPGASLVTCGYSGLLTVISFQ